MKTAISWLAHKLAFDRIAAITALAFLATLSSRAQSQLSVKWEELTAPEFVKPSTRRKRRAFCRSVFWKSRARIFGSASI